MKMILKNKKGFSLVELLVVIAIIGVLSGIAIPAYNNYKNQGTIEGVKASLNNAAKAILICLVRYDFAKCGTDGDENNELQSSGTDGVLKLFCEKCLLHKIAKTDSDPNKMCFHIADGSKSGCIQINPD
ncbi:MAG: type IV pilin protein, partial [Bdellovibrionales bacterium]